MGNQDEIPAVSGWEEAYLRQSHDAAVGRMFRGLVHNLNGALQVFSLQTDLFALSADRGDALMAQLRTCDLPVPAQALVQELSAALERRSESVRQMRDKLRSCEEIIQRTLGLPDFGTVLGKEPYTINSVIRTEVEFLGADSFFKHKVAKDLQLAIEPAPLQRGQLLLHQILFFLLENSIDAVRGIDRPRISIQALSIADTTSVVVADNGPGVSESDRERIFAPFATTRDGHLGLGLYLARKLTAELGGTLICEAVPEGAAFRLILPGI